MKKLSLDLVLAEPLAADLLAGAKQSEMTVSQFACQLIESELASRRLPVVSPGRSGARINVDDIT
jgi:hypothetical protein